MVPSLASTTRPAGSAATAPSGRPNDVRLGRRRRSAAQMSQFLGYLFAGLATGCIYAITSSGLVLTYTTSGIFNFAHGAIGMVAAFVYWQLLIGEHWPTPVALFVSLFVIAPLIGGLIEV